MQVYVVNNFQKISNYVFIGEEKGIEGMKKLTTKNKIRQVRMLKKKLKKMKKRKDKKEKDKKEAANKLRVLPRSR